MMEQQINVSITEHLSTLFKKVPKAEFLLLYNSFLKTSEYYLLTPVNKVRVGLGVLKREDIGALCGL